MTREEVKQQLAKNPLEWKRNIEGKLIAEVCTLERDVRITYHLIEDDVYIKASSGGVRTVGEFLGVESGEEALKNIAEAHRLDFICRLLRIKD